MEPNSKVTSVTTTGSHCCTNGCHLNIWQLQYLVNTKKKRTIHKANIPCQKKELVRRWEAHLCFNLKDWRHQKNYFSLPPQRQSPQIEEFERKWWLISTRRIPWPGHSSNRSLRDEIKEDGGERRVNNNITAHQLKPRAVFLARPFTITLRRQEGVRSWRSTRFEHDSCKARGGRQISRRRRSREVKK